ncbi:MAG: hypothetical protein J6W27_00700 [Alphaproteobacteria bacterium]|nr:hypothetical protein [Alphaproteobacteria bacterium]
MLSFPEIIPFDWNDPENLNKCYDIYLRSLYLGNHYFLGKKVHYDDKEIDGKHACFWHLITRNEKDFNERYPNRERLERIHWTAFMLENSESEDITCWEELVRTKKRGERYQTFLYSKQYKFVVILELQSHDLYRLVTSYYVDEKWRKDRFKQHAKRYRDPRKSIGSAV